MKLPSGEAPRLQCIPSMKEICESVRGHVPEIVREWEQLVWDSPWMGLPRAHRINGLPDLIVGLVEASLGDPEDLERHRQKVAAAVEHGVQRRAQGVDEHLVLTEYHLLREAMWRYLRRRYGPSDAATEAIMRIDTAITLATRASLQGYYRDELEAAGRWEGIVDRLAVESPLLKGPAREAEPSRGSPVAGASSMGSTS